MVPRPISPTLSNFSCMRSVALHNAVALLVDTPHGTRRVAHPESVRRHVPCHDTARRDHGVLANINATYQRRIGADTGAVVDTRGGNLPVAIEGARHLVVGETGIRPDKDVIANFNAMINRHAVLDLAACADFHRMIDI